MNLTIDKEFQQLIPEHQEEEFEGLKKSILEEGCRDSLVVWNGIILDGHHRYQICTKNGIPFKVVEKDFSSREDAKLWVINNQLGRRNLNDFQKSELVLVAKPLIAAKMKERQAKFHGNQHTGRLSENSLQVQGTKTDKELAKRAGVSDNTIRRVTTIKEKGTPEQIERARAGGKGNSINAVYTEIVHKDIEEKVCNCCGKKLPIAEFYGGKNRCKACTNRVRAGGGESQVQIMKEIERMADSHRVEDSRDCTMESAYDANDLESELLATVKNFSQSLNFSIDIHRDILDEDAKKRFLAVLDAAEHEIKKIKERLKL